MTTRDALYRWHKVHQAHESSPSLPRPVISDSHRTTLTSIYNDLYLAFNMRHAQITFHRHRYLPTGWPFGNEPAFNDSLEFCIKAKVWMVDTLDGVVCRIWNNTWTLNLVEFFFCFTSTCHTCQFFIHTEKGFAGNRCWCLVIWIGTPSLASIAWCNPSEYRRPSIVRPVNWSLLFFADHIVNIKNQRCSYT